MFIYYVLIETILTKLFAFVITHLIFRQIFSFIVEVFSEFFFNIRHRNEVDIIEKYIRSICIFQCNISQDIDRVIRLQRTLKESRRVARNTTVLKVRT